MVTSSLSFTLEYSVPCIRSKSQSQSVYLTSLLRNLNSGGIYIKPFYLFSWWLSTVKSFP